jgi:hypothetical protein
VLGSGLPPLSCIVECSVLVEHYVTGFRACSGLPLLSCVCVCVIIIARCCVFKTSCYRFASPLPLSLPSSHAQAVQVRQDLAAGLGGGLG